ncbi:AMP-binding protein [Bradyrhizobium sp. 13971]
MFRNLQRHLGFAYSRHRLCAGASISPETLRFFDIIGRPVSQGYGLTESGGVAFIQTESHHRIGGCGVPLLQTEWKCDTDGEILLRNPGVFKGYFLDEKASTASLEQGGWLRTGDIIEILDNGEIAVVDRKKAIIITAGGKNIAPSEIENALKDFRVHQGSDRGRRGQEVSRRHHPGRLRQCRPLGTRPGARLHQLQIAVAASRSE